LLLIVVDKIGSRRMLHGKVLSCITGISKTIVNDEGFILMLLGCDPFKYSVYFIV
jgi:hypothetical protein